jgi:hypothetical protein
MTADPQLPLFPAAMCERWLPVVGYEGRYEVSDFGNVRSLDRLAPHGRHPGFMQRKSGKLLKLGYHQGRPRVGLPDAQGKIRMRPVHKLVAAAFLGPCPPGMFVLHWDDDPKNNDRVFWWHTSTVMRRGTVKELDTNTTIGVLPDDGRSILYLKASQLGHIDIGASS